jgi:hypothetical protein
MTNHGLDTVGIPSTIITWLSIFEIINMDPVLSVVIKLFSLVWLSMQIYGWVEKRIKDKKHAKES